MFDDHCLSEFLAGLGGQFFAEGREAGPGVAVSQAFVALPLGPADSAPFAPAEIRIELRRAGVSIGVAWPVSAAGQCAAWLRELLR